MSKKHHYTVEVAWTGDQGSGTSRYDAYSRDHLVRVPGKAAIEASSDPSFRGDPARHNPEELFVASLSSCHMLWYLHLAAENGIVIVDYRDAATGTMVETSDGGGKFTDVTLHPTVTARAPVDEALAAQLHHRAHDLCFIANSVSFPVGCEPRLVVISADALPATPQADGA